MADDPFVSHKVFTTGVWWQPTDYKPMDQTVYLDYANRRFNDLRDRDNDRTDPSSDLEGTRTERPLSDFVGGTMSSVEMTERGLVIHLRLPSQEKHGS